MMIPPIVGVPAFAWWPSGPSSRMFWPNSRSCRNAMNLGDRKMQISSEAVPAIRTSPMRCDLPALERFGHGLQRDAARGLDQDDVARADDLRREGGGGRGVGHGVRLAAERAGRLRRQRADRHQHVDARRGGVLAEL